MATVKYYAVVKDLQLTCRLSKRQMSLSSRQEAERSEKTRYAFVLDSCAEVTVINEVTNRFIGKPKLGPIKEQPRYHEFYLHINNILIWSEANFMCA